MLRISVWSLLLLSMKMYLALACAVSALFAMESMGDSVTGTGSISSTAEPNKTTTRPIGAHNETATQSEMRNPTHKNPFATAETEGATITHSRDSSDHSPTNAEAATASSSGHRLPPTSAGAITAAGEAQSSPSAAITGAAHGQSPPTSIGGASSAASSATDTVSLPEASSTSEPEVASSSCSTDSPVDSTQTAAVIRQNFNSASASTPSTGSPTSKGVPYSHGILREASTSSTERSFTSQPRSVTMLSTVVFSSTGGSKSLSTTTKSTTTTAAPCGPTKSTASADVQPCSNWGVAKHCLIVIAFLSGLTTILMVSTITLCAKLTTRKYKATTPQRATEMMTFSSLLPEMNYSHGRRRNPVANGVLVMHHCGDSDEDEGDNMTLISFLPENDRLV